MFYDKIEQSKSVTRSVLRALRETLQEQSILRYEDEQRALFLGSFRQIFQLPRYHGAAEPSSDNHSQQDATFPSAPGLLLGTNDPEMIYLCDGRERGAEPQHGEISSRGRFDPRARALSHGAEVLIPHHNSQEVEGRLKAFMFQCEGFAIISCQESSRKVEYYTYKYSHGC